MGNKLLIFVTFLAFLISNNFNEANYRDLYGLTEKNPNCLIGFDGIKYQMRNDDIFILEEMDDNFGFHLYSEEGETFIFRYKYCDLGDDTIILCSVNENQDVKLEFSKCGKLDCYQKEVFTQIVILKRDSPIVGVALCN